MITETIRAHEARRLHDPNTLNAVEHVFTVNVLDLPNLPLGSNPREQNPNKEIYRDVRDSLLNENGSDNAFLGKNLGIYACAEEVVKHSDDEYEIKFSEGDTILDGKDGVINGGHTASIIWSNQEQLREKLEQGEEMKQFVKLHVRVGYPRDMLAEMAGTLNTTLQVQEYSLAEHKSKFNWIHQAIAGKPYENEIAFKENVPAPYYVTDVLAMLDLFNIDEYPNDGGKHPTGAYREKTAVLKRYLKDQTPFKRLEPILNDILVLHDTIACEGKDKYNEYTRNQPGRQRGGGGHTEWVNTRKRGEFDFPFIQKHGKSRIDRAAIYPAMAAFRWMVKDNGSKAKWKGGFSAVETAWQSVGPEMMKMTQDTSVENARKTLAIGKSATHYNALHSTVAKHELMNRA